MKLLLAGLLILIIISSSGCYQEPLLDRQPLYAMADNQLLWDKSGCAYFVKPGRLGDISFVVRYYAEDKDDCVNHSNKVQ